MANMNYGDANGYFLEWRIENISNCWWIGTDDIESPIFVADGLEDTKWRLRLCLQDGEDCDRIGIYLVQVKNCSGGGTMEVNYEVAFLDEKERSLLNERHPTHCFFNIYGLKNCGFSDFETREKVFNTEKESFLPKDTLTIQCKICNKKRLFNGKQLYARTVFSTNHSCFTWRIDEFSTVKSALRRKFRNNFLDLDFVLNEDGYKKLDVDFISFHDNLKYISINTSILNAVAKNSVSNKYFVDDLEKGELTTMFKLPSLLRSDSKLYKPCDVLYIEFDVVYTIKEDFAPNTDFLIDDLKSMFYDAILSDTDLRTATKSFPAHKSILSARSPVFTKMFCSDMKEKNTGHVDIIDLEDDTVHRMLLYVYTDSLEDLQFETALKLYAAADKYEILSMRNKCSTFLKGGLCPNIACDVLILSDLHHDNDLKSTVQSYILEHEEVFNLSEWKHLMDNNLKLAADVMYQKITQKNKGVLPDDGKERTENMAALIDDLKSMFCDAILSDTELRTATKSFPAHKSILSARSPVFKKMFDSDMKEKNTGHVDITDLEEDTVHRMLLYVYTDSLGDLQFETALKLYAAADKYEILSLRNKCSTLLKDGLCPNRACDVLILSDLHHDDDLKSAVESYILEHEEVFNLSEWKHLMDNKIKLAADVMYQKITQEGR